MISAQTCPLVKWLDEDCDGLWAAGGGDNCRKQSGGEVPAVVKPPHGRRQISGQYFSGSYITKMKAGSMCFLH
jgi:hypothetical protein